MHLYMNTAAGDGKNGREKKKQRGSEQWKRKKEKGTYHQEAAQTGNARVERKSVAERLDRCVITEAT